MVLALKPGQEGPAPEANLRPYFSQEQSFIGRGNVENLDLASYSEPHDKVLSPPKSIWVIAGSGNITVNWSRQSLAAKYHVAYGEQDSKQTQTAIVDAPFFNLRQVVPGKLYSFTVSSVTKDGTSSRPSPRLTVSTAKLKQTSQVKKNNFQVAAWTASDFTTARTKTSVERGFGTLTEINPFWYNFSSGALLEPKGGARDPELVARSHQNGMQVIPTITNNFDAKRVSKMLQDKALTEQLINDLTHEVTTYDYDGIDLDFENMLAKDRDKFSDFVLRLSQRLHTEKKLLEVTVQPKKADSDDWDGPGALDATKLGASADRIKVMTYDYSRPDTAPGPIAPPDWIREVLNYWQSKVPAKKILGGVPLYGYDWATKTGESTGLDWDSVVRLKKKYKVKEGLDQASAEPFFSYAAEDGPHVVYYQDTTSLAQKVGVIKETGVAGVAAWVLGGDNPNNFLAIANATHDTKRVIQRPLNIGLKLDGHHLAVSLSKFKGIESFLLEYGPAADQLDKKTKPVSQSIIKLPDLAPGETRFVRAWALDHSGKRINQSQIAHIDF